jgi:Uma2 family endonuclease
MTPEEFLAWCLTQEGKWELVNGEPVQMMAGATTAHDRIVTNLIVALGAKLRGGPCWPKTADIASRMRSGNMRRPDVTVDCGKSDPKSLESSEPTVFFEVLSPSTRTIDQVKKPDEYRQLDALKHFVLLDPARAHAWVWGRGEDGWSAVDVIGLDGAISLHALGFDLAMREIYDGVELAGDA